MTKIDELRQAAAQACGLTIDELLSPLKTRSRANARFVMALLAKEKNQWWSNIEIARCMGRVDATTGRNALIAARALIGYDPEFQSAMARARAILDAKKD